MIAINAATSYSTVLLPDWIEHLADYRLGSAVLAGEPVDHIDPPLILVDYSAINSGLGGPPYLAAIVAIDRFENWAGLDEERYRAKRALWGERLIATVDRAFPGFAANVVTHR